MRIATSLQKRKEQLPVEQKTFLRLHWFTGYIYSEKKKVSLQNLHSAVKHHLKKEEETVERHLEPLKYRAIQVFTMTTQTYGNLKCFL